MKHLGRKIYHLFGGLLLLSLYFVFGRERTFVIYAILTVLVLAGEVVRFAFPGVNRVLLERFGSFIRPSEATKITGTAPYVIGVWMALLLYRREIAAPAICFLAFGDVAATTAGERWGRTKIGQKSIEGSAAFFVAAAATGLLLSLAGLSVAPGIIIAGAFIAAAVELLPLPVNDNLLIPLAAGGAMELIARMTGYV